MNRSIYFLIVVDFISYLNNVHGIHLPPVGISHCISLIFTFASTICSTLLIVSMTFDRCYSILRPHKAASFNTVKRAKITIACIAIFSLIYNIPQYFLAVPYGASCAPYTNAEGTYGQMYYWFSTLMNFGIPFTSLLVMNSYIIHTLRRRRSNFTIKLEQPGTVNHQGQVHGQGHSRVQRQGHDNNKGQGHENHKGQSHGYCQGQSGVQGQTVQSAVKSPEFQIYAILLLVTFSFLSLTTPAYVIMLYIITVDVDESPEAFAEFYLLQNIGEKLLFTNGAINFFLYVISGKKFRKDLFNLFQCKFLPTRETR